MELNKNYILIVLIILSLFLVGIPNILAQPVTNIILDRGVDIVHPETLYVEYNKDLEFNFWTYNSTTGGTLTNASLNCTLYIIDNEGVNYYKFSNQPGSTGLITYGKGMPLCLNCWTMTMPKENLSLGSYSYQIKCQGNMIGGYYTGFFYVTRTGTIAESSESIIHVILFLGLCLWFFVTLLGSVFLPFKDKRNEEYKIVEINDLKYVKVISMVLCYISMVFIFGYLDSLANSYITLYNFSYLFRYGYLVLLSIMFPILIVSIIFMGIMFLESRKIKEMLHRGIIK